MKFNELVVSVLCATFLLVTLSLNAGGLINSTYAANTNSEEVEQIGQQLTEDCNTSLCVNILSQSQPGAVADVSNVGNIFDDVSNSAEVEQFAKQLNKDCDTAICANVVLAEVQDSPVALSFEKPISSLLFYESKHIH